MTECAPQALRKGKEGKGESDSSFSSLSKALQGVSPLGGLNLIFRGGGASLRALGVVMLVFGLTKGEQAIYMPFMLGVWKVRDPRQRALEFVRCTNLIDLISSLKELKFQFLSF